MINDAKEVISQPSFYRYKFDDQNKWQVSLEKKNFLQWNLTSSQYEDKKITSIKSSHGMSFVLYKCLYQECSINMYVGVLNKYMYQALDSILQALRLQDSYTAEWKWFIHEWKFRANISVERKFWANSENWFLQSARWPRPQRRGHNPPRRHTPSQRGTPSSRLGLGRGATGWTLCSANTLGPSFGGVWVLADCWVLREMKILCLFCAFDHHHACKYWRVN